MELEVIEVIEVLEVEGVNEEEIRGRGRVEGEQDIRGEVIVEPEEGQQMGGNRWQRDEHEHGHGHGYGYGYGYGNGNGYGERIGAELEIRVEVGRIMNPADDEESQADFMT